MKIILALCFSISVFATKPSPEKVEYLLSLINIEKDWGNLGDKEYQKIVAKTPVFKLVEKEMQDYLAEVFEWSQIKAEAVKVVSQDYSEKEVNKLIAIYELPVMKKFSKSYKSKLNPHLKKFVKSRLKKDDPRFVEIRNLLKKRYREKNVKPLKK